MSSNLVDTVTQILSDKVLERFGSIRRRRFPRRLDGRHGHGGMRRRPHGRHGRRRPHGRRRWRRPSLIVVAVRAPGTGSNSDLPDRLACGSHHRGPQVARRVEVPRAANRRADRHVDQLVVPVADQHVGLSRHARVNGHPSHLVAQDPVSRIGGDAADVVARVDVLQVDRDLCRS